MEIYLVKRFDILKYSLYIYIFLIAKKYFSYFQYMRKLQTRWCFLNKPLYLQKKFVLLFLLKFKNSLSYKRKQQNYMLAFNIIFLIKKIKINS